jgi:hypothetical protein
VAIEILEDVLDENLAAETLAEKAHVFADHRPQIEQDRRVLPRERRDKLAQRLGGKHGIAGGRRGGARDARIAIHFARRDEVQEAHGKNRDSG